MITTLLTSVACGGMGTGGEVLGSGSTIVSDVRRIEAGCRQAWHDDCPEGAACNPPPPVDVQCPPELLKAGDEILFHSDGSCELDAGNTKTSLPCPTVVEISYAPPPAEKPSYLITRTGDHCEGSFSSSCPTGAPCNPPAPERLKCPEALNKDGTRLTFDGGSCSVHYPQDCAPGEPCPESVLIPCPDLEALKQ